MVRIGESVGRRVVAVLAFLSLHHGQALALVEGATIVRGTAAGRHIVMVVSTRANVCTGTALAQDLVLTAAHCVAPAATYRVLLDAPPGFAVKSIVINPRYSPTHYASGRVTADVALIKLEAPLPAAVVPAPLAADRKVARGDRFIVAGYGATAPGSETGIGTPRAAALVATGRPGNLQIRLMDPVTRDQRAGLGACTGDSGAPAFVESGGRYTVVGVVSWSTGPAGSDGCGGLTGVTPLSLHRAWIAETSRRLGSALTP